MRPLDPRLLRYARSARGYILLTAGLGLATALAVIAQAWFLGNATAPVVEGRADLADVLPLVGALAGAFALRALLVGVQERYAHRAATRVVAELRVGVLDRAVTLGPRWLAEGHAASTTTLVTRGLDSLEPYFVRYLPQLVLAVTVTPAVLAVIAGLDLLAAVTITVTLPLIPIFMVLVGRLTQRYAQQRLVVMQRLGTQLLDLLAGLATLKALGRERGPGRRVRELGEAYRQTTMQTLRVAFLSGAVLELLATLSVALVAVGIGLRLVLGELDLTTGLVVLVLAPEVYLPLRQVGAHFHASSDGVAAAGEAFGVLEEPLSPPGSVPAPDLRTSVVAWEGVGVRAPGRDRWAPAHLDASVRPGTVVALAGPSGSGKSTAAAVLLGLVRPDRGRVVAIPASGEPVDLAEIDLRTWWEQVAWVPQRPALLPGTVLANLLGSDAPPDAAVDEQVRRAAALTGLDDVVAQLPRGWATPLGHGGVGLSVGQRQRLALTRALLGSHQLVLLDEPTAHLDADAEARVGAAIAALVRAGRTVVVVAHRRAVLDLAQDVVAVEAADTVAPANAQVAQ